MMMMVMMMMMMMMMMNLSEIFDQKGEPKWVTVWRSRKETPCLVLHWTEKVLTDCVWFTWSTILVGSSKEVLQAPPPHHHQQYHKCIFILKSIHQLALRQLQWEKCWKMAPQPLAMMPIDRVVSRKDCIFGSDKNGHSYFHCIGDKTFRRG